MARIVRDGLYGKVRGRASRYDGGNASMSDNTKDILVALIIAIIGLILALSYFDVLVK